MSFFGTRSAGCKPTGKGEPTRPIFVFDPNFQDGPDDVVMEDAEAETTSMEADISSIPEEFFCCITMCVMVDPWIDIEGKSYEKQAIFDWLQRDKTSPLTKTPMSAKDLRPNPRLCEEIQKLRRAHPGLDWD